MRLDSYDIVVLTSPLSLHPYLGVCLVVVVGSGIRERHTHTERERGEGGGHSKSKRPIYLGSLGKYLV